MDPNHSNLNRTTHNTDANMNSANENDCEFVQSRNLLCNENIVPSQQIPEFFPRENFSDEARSYDCPVLPRSQQRQEMMGHLYVDQYQQGYGSVGFVNDPPFTSSTGAFSNPLRPQYLISNQEYARHHQHAVPRHADFLDPNTLAMELERINYFRSTYPNQFGRFGLQMDPQRNLDKPGMFSTLANNNSWIKTNGYLPLHLNMRQSLNLAGGNALAEKFQAQQRKFSELPLEAHRKIQSMPGYEIINIFQITLTRLMASKLIESPNAFAVFTRRPDTRQHWLMAFAVRKDHFLKCVIKFNRLLTSHLKVTIIDHTAVQLESSKLSKSFLGEQFIFRMANEGEAKQFLDTLEYGRRQVWIGSENFLKENLVNKVGGSAPYGQLYDRGSRGSFPNAGGPSTRANSRFKRNPTFCNDFVLDSVEKRIRESRSTKEVEEFSSICKQIKFSVEVTLFINESESELRAEYDSTESETDVPRELQYSEYGNGTLCIVEKPNNSFDEIVFIMNKTDVACSHKIYAWNELILDNEQAEGKQIMCSWNGMVSFAKDSTQFPTLRQFRTNLDGHDAAQQFHDIFSEAKVKASNGLKRQILR